MSKRDRHEVTAQSRPQRGRARRWAAIAVVLVAMLCMAAGCLSAVQPFPYTVAVHNDDQISHSVTVLVSHENETIVNQSRAVNVDATWQATTFADPGDYTVTVKTMNASYTETVTLTDTVDAPESFTTVRITRGGTLNGTVADA